MMIKKSIHIIILYEGGHLPLLSAEESSMHCGMIVKGNNYSICYCPAASQYFMTIFKVDTLQCIVF